MLINYKSMKNKSEPLTPCSMWNNPTKGQMLTELGKKKGRWQSAVQKFCSTKSTKSNFGCFFSSFFFSTLHQDPYGCSAGPPSWPRSHITRQSISGRRHWQPMQGFNWTRASSRSTLGARKCDNVNVVLQEGKVPLAPFLERWNIECDTGSNCTGSNQLDTQLKET